MPELSNFIPQLFFAHCRRSRSNIIDPVLEHTKKGKEERILTQYAESDYSPAKDSRPVDFWRGEDEVEPSPRSGMEVGGGRKNEDS